MRSSCFVLSAAARWRVYDVIAKMLNDWNGRVGSFDFATLAKLPPSHFLITFILYPFPFSTAFRCLRLRNDGLSIARHVTLQLAIPYLNRALVTD